MIPSRWTASNTSTGRWRSMSEVCLSALRRTVGRGWRTHAPRVGVVRATLPLRALSHLRLSSDELRKCSNRAHGVSTELADRHGEPRPTAKLLQDVEKIE